MRLKISPYKDDIKFLFTKIRRDHQQDVQNMTCDHNCVINTGLMSARVKRVCNAVMKDRISSGEVGGGESENIACKGAPEGRARVNVCLRDDEMPFGGDIDIAACWKDGDGDLVCCVGDDGIPLRKGVEFANVVVFFFLLNGRRNDQSDSNWTDSNSEDNAEYSRSAASRI